MFQQRFANENPGWRYPKFDRFCKKQLCNLLVVCTVKLGIKELFDKEQIGIKEPFPVTNLPFTS